MPERPTLHAAGHELRALLGWEGAGCEVEQETPQGGRNLDHAGP